MVACTFYSIVLEELPNWRVYEDDGAIAFLDIAQVTPGHTLVVPRRHAPDIWAMSEDDAAQVMRAVHRVASLLHDRLDPIGLNVTQANGHAAWQEVLHYHVHLVPRYGNDGLTPPWRSTSPSTEVLADTHRKRSRDELPALS
jgi:histidine triad (HIT) family protein